MDATFTTKVDAKWTIRMAIGIYICKKENCASLDCTTFPIVNFGEIVYNMRRFGGCYALERKEYVSKQDIPTVKFTRYRPRGGTFRF